MRLQHVMSWLAAAAILLGLASASFAQEGQPAGQPPAGAPAVQENQPTPGGPGGPGQPGEPGGRGMRGERGGLGGPGGPGMMQGSMQEGVAAIEKVMKDNDADANGALSEEEYLAMQKKVFAESDGNKDGSLDNREFIGLIMRMVGRPGGPQGMQPPVPGGPGAPGAAPEGAAAQEDAGQRGAGGFLARLDSNSDGKITKDEMPERMQESFAQMDTNGDGALDQTELSAMGERLRGRGEGGGARGGAPGAGTPAQ